jgi:adenylate cyclase
VHVDLNDTAVQQLKTYYVSRSQYARVIANLSAMGSAAQAYDVIFAAETSQADDQAIIRSTEESKNVYFGMDLPMTVGKEAKAGRTAPEVGEYMDRTKWSVRVDGDLDSLYSGSKPLITFPSLARASRGIGFLTLHYDLDGVIRRVPLLVRYENGFYPSFPFRVVCDYLGVTPDRITVQPGRYIKLEGARKPGGAPRDVLIPIDEHGAMIINFIGPWETMTHYNFARILAASDDRDEMGLFKEDLAGKIVVISDISTGATDIGIVPVDINFPLAGLHASVIYTILSGNFLSEISGTKMLAVEIGILAIIFLMSIGFSPVFFMTGSTLLIVGYVTTALWLFLTKGLMLDVLGPTLPAAASASFIMGFRYFQDKREREILRRSFESYFPPAVVKKILANPGILNRGQRKVLTILFSDIKDFTHHSSTYSPDRIRAFLNEYFETMVDIVFKYNGTLDKYIGDGLMVFFGDPEPLPDHAPRAVQAAIAMQKKAAALMQKWLREGGFPLQIRIGINTGEVVVGNMGSSKRLSYTVLGSAVNLAKRLESSAPTNGILLSHSTYELIKSSVPTRFFGEIQVKGIEAPVSTYEVVPEDLMADEPRISGAK